MSDLDQARRFLRLLFEAKPPEHHVLIWKLAGRHSRFFTDIEAAAGYAAEQKRDIYFGVGLSPQNFGPDRRCTAAEITGIAGLWADIDIFHPIAHSKQNLPPDEQAALNILKQIPTRATLIVHSGHGLQAYWLFKEPWIFQSDDERQKAAELTQKWNQWIRNIAHRMNLDVDSVHDLARVLRIPGTVNAKEPQEPKPVRVKWGKEDRRYNPSELAELVADIEITESAAGAGDWRRQAEESGLILDPERQPPLDKYQTLRRTSRRFVKTLDHERPEIRDQSTSSYDLALAAIAVRAGWTDQEITDLLIFHQRKFPLDSSGHVRGIKGMRDRPRYFVATIAKARAAAQSDPRIDTLRRHQAGHSANGAGALAVSDDEGPPLPDAPPASAIDTLDELSKILRVKIVKIIKQLSDPPLYSIETDRGRVAIGEVQNLIEQRALRNRLAMLGVYLTKRKEDEWEPIATALLECCTAVETTADATYQGAARGWIREYLRESTVMDSLEEADRGQNPFIKDGTLIISSAGLRKFLIMNNGERQLTARELTDALRSIGAQPRIHFLEAGEKRTSRSLWELPGKADEYQ